MNARKLGIATLIITVAIGIGTLFSHDNNEKSYKIPKETNKLIIKNDTIEELNIKTLDGKVITKDDIKGKIVIIDFWATWCPPCVAQVPLFNKIEKEYNDTKIIALSVDKNTGKIPAFIQNKNITYSVGISNKEINNTVGGIQGIPTAIIFNREGKKIKKAVGYHDEEFFKKIIKKTDV